MKGFWSRSLACLLVSLSATLPASAQTAKPKSQAVPVTADNFRRAESDMYFSEGCVSEVGLGKFVHRRMPVAIEKQTIARSNRDFLYSSAVFDLDAGPVTVTLPDVGGRYVAMQALDEDQYVTGLYYGTGSYTFSREQVGTRSFMLGVRILVDPTTSTDLTQAQEVQDGIRVSQKAPGRFEVPNWDLTSQRKVREALAILGSTLPDTRGMFGARAEVDPVRHLIGSAIAWGGNPEKDVVYLNVKPSKNDGATIHEIRVKDVPVDGFWSISVYDVRGFFQANPLDAYSLNSVTAAKERDGSVTVQFG